MYFHLELMFFLQKKYFFISNIIYWIKNKGNKKYMFLKNILILNKEENVYLKLKHIFLIHVFSSSSFFFFFFLFFEKCMSLLQ